MPETDTLTRTAAAPAAAPTLLDLQHLEKHFGGVTAVGDLSMSVKSGAIHGLIGPNGAGKTTIINLLTGLYSIDGGTITFDGTPVNGLEPHEIAALGIARTYQNVRLFKGMTALEQVVTGCWLKRGTSLFASFLGLPEARRARKATEAHALSLLERVGMASRAHELAETLSYGEQRRIELARALGSDPKLLLLDEPTAGMNHSEASAIGHVVRDLRNQGLTVLLVEHNMGLVTEFCDTCTVINFGRLLAEGDPHTCLSAPDVQEAYFGRRRDADRFQSLR
ncbi:ABC transporter ATP-binding protein [Acuticoccus sp. I52.16.1]|uniref:ABC transporter ATP-binding protein n=1 Tax=Acuticoccus sp. I52.16.1 TaxID=2928472 RepID=UPI001FD350FA|nr:ABC transporter ATP-binding protein [Acuticoccus sp. I52.16.1]UOM35392.1 ABC transporter ATP-binding protein [Acuticoccus sp. I52.16.1]